MNSGRWGIGLGVLVATVFSSVSVEAAQQSTAPAVAAAAAAGQAAPAQPPPGLFGPRPPRKGAPIDLTGYWVSVVTEDWRFRMLTPAKGDYMGVPVTAAAVREADGWDPDADERNANQCRSYGAPAIMRVPGRLHITWVDDNTLQIETDAGMQKRLFRFGADALSPAERSWQGTSTASWELPDPTGQLALLSDVFGPIPNPFPANGTLKVVTTDLRAGYLRKNGVPYSENAALTEYFDVVQDRKGTRWLVVMSIVEDPLYLTHPFVLSTQFKKQPDATGWEPTPCSSTW